VINFNLSRIEFLPRRNFYLIDSWVCIVLLGTYSLVFCRQKIMQRLTLVPPYSALFLPAEYVTQFSATGPDFVLATVCYVPFLLAEMYRPVIAIQFWAMNLYFVPVTTGYTPFLPAEIYQLP